MSDWDDETLNVAIRAIMKAPDGRPSYNLLDAFHKLYHQHEMAKCFSGGKKKYAEYSKTPLLLVQ